jgi:hypothetical protein
MKDLISTKVAKSANIATALVLAFGILATSAASAKEPTGKTAKGSTPGPLTVWCHPYGCGGNDGGRP